MLIFDLGGDSLSVTIIIMDSDGTVQPQEQRMSRVACGNTFDKILFKFCTDHFETQNGVTWPKDNKLAKIKL